MTAEKVREFIRQRPFRPFRIFMSDGSSHDVLHPEFAALTRREVWVLVPQGDEEIPDRAVLCDLLHVTRIEPTPQAKSKQRRGRSNGH
jgi:hypothetical protein